MLRKFLIIVAILTSQNALACAINTSSAQYEKNIEGNIALKEQQLSKYKKLGYADDNKTIVDFKEQYKEALESQPISKNVNVEKYDVIYNKCVAKLDAKNNTVTAPLAPCSNEYPVKECATEAFEGSKNK